MKRTITQKQMILRDLQNGRTITPLEALRDYGCFQLPARIFELKEAGYRIKTTLVKDGEKRYARYSLIVEN